jgi:selenium metabolism protein YedF
MLKMKEVDARGLTCPKPVIMTKKALSEEEQLLVLVDNEVAANNVAKLAKKMGCQVTTLAEKGNYKLTIKQVDNLDASESRAASIGKTYFITSNLLGEGESELGEILMKGFISTLLEIDPLPVKIIFMNSGVKIPTLNKAALESLEILADKGVEILSCGTCLDYYGLTEKLKIGNISNMYEILASLNSEDIVKI